MRRWPQNFFMPRCLLPLNRIKGLKPLPQFHRRCYYLFSGSLLRLIRLDCIKLVKSCFHPVLNCISTLAEFYSLFCFHRQPRNFGGPSGRALRHRGGRGSHRSQDLGRHHELSELGLRGDRQGLSGLWNTQVGEETGTVRIANVRRVQCV